MFANKKRLISLIDMIIEEKKFIYFRIIFLFLCYLAGPFPYNSPILVVLLYWCIILLRDYHTLSKNYHRRLLNLHNNIYDKSNYSIKEVEELLAIKAYFFFKYPFHRDNHQIYLYLKYFLFISYFMSKDYEKAYAVVDEIDNFVEKYVIDANKKIKEKNEKIKDENDKRKRWKRKKMVDYIPEIDYPGDYTKEKINGKGLLSYLENEEDEYAIKLKELFLQKKKYYENKENNGKGRK